MVGRRLASLRTFVAMQSKSTRRSLSLKVRHLRPDHVNDAIGLSLDRSAWGTSFFVDRRHLFLFRGLQAGEGTKGTL